MDIHPDGTRLATGGLGRNNQENFYKVNIKFEKKGSYLLLQYIFKYFSSCFMHN